MGLFNRAAWCFFDDVYHVAGRIGSSQDWATVDRTAIDELLTVALLGPILGTNIRAPVRSELLCTDACAGVFTGIGGVKAEVLPEVARELYRHRTRRGGYVRAETPEEVRRRERADWCGRLLELRPDLADGFDDIDAASGSRWFGEICKCIQWRRTFQYRSKGEPINRGELRGVRTAVRRLLRKAVISECGRSLVSIRMWSKACSRKVAHLRVSSIFYYVVWLRICWSATFNWGFSAWLASTIRETTLHVKNECAGRDPILLRNGRVASSRATSSQ